MRALRALRAHPWIIFWILLAVVGVVVWRVWTESGPLKPLSAQEAIENACPNLVDQQYMDMSRSGDTWRREYQYSSAGNHLKRYRISDDRLVSETIQIWDTPVNLLARSARGSQPAIEIQATVHHREWSDEGVWSPWEVSRTSENYKATGADIFCGHDLGEYGSVVYNGVQSLNGRSTRKFTLTYDFNPDSSSHTRIDVESGIWVDRHGLPVKKTLHWLRDDHTDVMLLSGWGQRNNIVAPGSPAPTPTPDPNATSTPTPTPTPPPPAGNPSVSDVTATSVRVSWDKVRPSGTYLQDVRVNYRTTGTSAWTFGAYVDIPTWSSRRQAATVDGLTCGTAYDFQVEAKYSNSWHHYTSTVSV